MNRLAVLPLLIPVILAACGDDGGNKKIDAGTSTDTLTDIDAPSGVGNVKVTITGASGPVAGVRVHFQGPDSTLISSADTDAAGVARADVPTGGYVTAVNPFNAPGGTSAELTSWAGVKPGDELVLKEFPGSGVTTTTFIAPIDTTGTVTDYFFSTQCDYGLTASAGTVTSTQRDLDLYVDCLPNTDVVIASLDTNGEVVHWLYAPNVDASSGTVDLSGMAITGAPMTKTVTFNNIPVAGGGIEYEDSLSSATGPVIKWGASTASGTTYTDMTKMTPFTGAVDAVRAVTGAPYGQHTTLDWGAFSTSYTVDVAARQLHEATSGASYDTTAHRVIWTEASAGIAPDFAVTETKTFRSAANLYIYWQLVGPYAAGVLQYPTLPVETTDFNAGATDVVEVYNGMSVIKVPGGFDAVREVFYATTGPQGLAASGQATIEDIEEGVLLWRKVRRALGNVTAHKRNAWSSPWKFRHGL